jgi:SAM-dependent methyltransferase
MSELDDLEKRLAALEKSHAALKGFIVPAYWNLLDQLYDRTPAPDAPVCCLACGIEAPDAAYRRRLSACAFDGGKLERLECPACGCVFGPLKYLNLPERVVELDYRLLYTHYAEADSTAEEVRAFHALDPLPGGLYLNWGSGAWSRTVETLRALGFDVWGYEPNAPPDSRHVARSRAEISARFDGIFSNNVVEHLTDPVRQFADFHAILKPGGRMAHATPCHQWLYDHSRFHVFFPLAGSIERLAARTGFSLVDQTDDGEFMVRVFQRND